MNGKRMKWVLWMPLLLAGLGGGALAQGPTESTSQSCGTVEPHDGSVEVVSSFLCSCAGKGQEWAGEVDFGAVSWSGGGSSQSSSIGLVCQTTAVKVGYDSLVEDGPYQVTASGTVYDFAYIASCGTGGCWSFLFISGSGASCKTKREVLGTHTHYKVVGVCPEPFESTGQVPGVTQ